MALQRDQPFTALGGEPLDALVWRVLGRGSGSLERILEANPGLATIAEALPEGTPVTIPAAADADQAAAPGMIQLWD